MADNMDDDVIVELIDTGLTTVKSIDSPTEEVPVGSLAFGEPGQSTINFPENSVVDEVEDMNSPSHSVPVPTSVASGDEVSLDNLRAVSSMFDKGCQTFSAIVKDTGLPQSTVRACIKWLVDNGLLAVSNSFYCTLDNVSTLHSQLNVCQKCFGDGKK